MLICCGCRGATGGRLGEASLPNGNGSQGRSPLDAAVAGRPPYHSAAPAVGSGRGTSLMRIRVAAVPFCYVHATGRWIVRPLDNVTTSGSWHFAGRSRGMFL